jgi:hypothetical protein
MMVRANDARPTRCRCWQEHASAWHAELERKPTARRQDASSAKQDSTRPTTARANHAHRTNTRPALEHRRARFVVAEQSRMRREPAASCAQQDRTRPKTRHANNAHRDAFRRTQDHVSALHAERECKPMPVAQDASSVAPAQHRREMANAKHVKWARTQPTMERASVKCVHVEVRPTSTKPRVKCADRVGTRRVKETDAKRVRSTW